MIKHTQRRGQGHVNPRPVVETVTLDSEANFSV